MHIHILGICGTFMGSMALLARAAGHTVTGCDANVYPPMSTQLEAQGIALIQGYEATQLDLAPDVFVVGNAISRGNPLLEAILDAGAPYVSGPQWLADHVLRGKWVLAVAGTHGKTTTASMLAWLLEDGGLNPGFLIGGVAENFGVSARLTDSPFFVIEADEYDTAFCDKRSKFVHYRPRTAILNNLEFDHADIFPDLVAIETQFHHLVRTLPRLGRIIVNAEAPALARVLARGVWSEVEYFNDPAGWSATALDEGSAQLALAGQAVGAAVMPMAGAHNRSNALAAVAAARHAGVPVAASMAALARFKGVKRRLERRGAAAGVTVYDDFAHHPTAIALTLAGLRQREAGGRILAVLEPRSNTMKLGVMNARLPESLMGADAVFCYAGGVDWDVAEALAPLGDAARVFDGLDALVAAVAAVARPGDHVLVMSNGGFGGVHDKLLTALAQ
ncbi:MAG: UDP-N-acetylmuramate:L-alanyl-gamma-D-glutamyl-meso-diaminopimelate ligase [Rhodocyclaceae bacterium]|nr:UDP-N-acetylmuramate:L-alanyl-gamma-D-glutamyl-meso-diaminopimelate ligase [Rhodocyclaceae bacterium]